mmetsp:Transcript_39135/g.122414  ORF Transcript_39135/g.122414 Transcript_39135/m.122414 type:complete len:88 (+) Transcript_39135:393-656(+)
MSFKVNEDLPGQGQFFCTPCSRHFINSEAYAVHCRSRPHKRRLKDVAQEQYTQAEADLGAGRTKEVLPSASEARAAAAAAADAAMDM